MDDFRSEKCSCFSEENVRGSARKLVNMCLILHGILFSSWIQWLSSKALEQSLSKLESSAVNNKNKPLTFY